MKTSFGVFALVSFLALQAGAAHACGPGQAAYYKNGEQYCYSTSDGGGQTYRPSTVDVTKAGHGAQEPHTKAEQAVEAAQRRRQHLY